MDNRLSLTVTDGTDHEKVTLGIASAIVHILTTILTFIVNTFNKPITPPYSPNSFKFHSSIQPWLTIPSFRPTEEIRISLIQSGHGLPLPRRPRHALSNPRGQ